MKKKYLLLLLSLCLAGILPAQITPTADRILYVNKAVSGGNGNGSSWANAIPELADALKWTRAQYDANNNWLAGDSLRIYIAEGTYKPLYDADNGRYQNDGGRDNAFVIMNRVHLYGGFPSTGNPGMGQRNWKTYSTTLSGDIGAPNDAADNVYHVLISMGGGNVHLDGLKITGGNANATHQTPLVRIPGNDITYIRNTGAGSLLSGNHSLRLSNMEISGNTAAYAGGGYIFGTPVFTNTEVRNNTAVERGGGLYFTSPYEDPVVAGSLFTGNTSKLGGAIYSRDDSLVVINTTFADNTATTAGNAICSEAAYISGQSVRNPVLVNSILWNSTPNAVSMIENTGDLPFIITYSIVQGNSVAAGTGNSNANPLFTNAGSGNYTLMAASPAINTGNTPLWNAANITGTMVDLAGNPRVAGNAIDRGAFELQTVLPVSFGSFRATLKNGQLLFNWNTETEINSDHFLVQVSADGANWETVQTVQSKATTGNSHTVLEYAITIPLTMLGLSAGFLLLGTMAYKRRRREPAVAAFLVCILSFACHKTGIVKSAETGALFARLVQVDKDGAQRVSKTIQVVRE
ncbi:choice-of-anchor Q domain-containing protein [Niabella aurantiaca]|uniref:choice-of-anchor Q domain-containing protein n=1 Tax=Niabella aurantiaca TaxID=379900 RepID=UPI000369DED3|nr:choice-of-anchor Q domain-containing protein [Niabella aurantiaca]